MHFLVPMDCDSRSIRTSRSSILRYLLQQLCFFPLPSFSRTNKHQLKCPFFVIANVPLCPFNATTGSTEFWLGSHASTSGKDQVIATPETTLANATLRVGDPVTYVLPEVVEMRRQIRPPIQPVCEKGDIMLRDLRTWHAGMPNESDQYRIMLALGYQVCLSTLSNLCLNLNIIAIYIPEMFSMLMTSQNRHNGTRTTLYE